jgi:thiosulfate reductase cytochrome b subunit
MARIHRGMKDGSDDARVVLAGSARPGGPAVRRLASKHPLAIRWFHWLNFPLLALMIWSGLYIYWANPVYRVAVGEHTLVAMTLPQEGYRALGLNNHLARGMALHFAFMWLFAINGVAYVLFLASSGEWRELLPRRDTLRHAWHTVLHDLHLRREAPPPAKFNGAQRLAYTTVVLMGAGSLLTGLAIYKPVQLGWLTAVLGGYETARFLHFWLTVGFVAFFLVHVAQVVRAGWNNFRAMVIGVEVVDEEPVEGVSGE